MVRHCILYLDIFINKILVIEYFEPGLVKFPIVLNAFFIEINYNGEMANAQDQNYPPSVYWYNYNFYLTEMATLDVSTGV